VDRRFRQADRGIYGENPRLLDDAKQAEVTAHPVPQKYPRTEGVYADGSRLQGCTPRDRTSPSTRTLTEMVLLGNLAVRTAQPIDVNPATVWSSRRDSGGVHEAAVSRRLDVVEKAGPSLRSGRQLCFSFLRGQEI